MSDEEDVRRTPPKKKTNISMLSSKILL